MAIEISISTSSGSVTIAVNGGGSAQVAGNGNTGSGPNAGGNGGILPDPGPGGNGGILPDPGPGGNGGILPDPGPGGGGAGSALLVVGPIVVGRSCPGGASSPGAGGNGGILPDPGPGGNGGILPDPGPGGNGGILPDPGPGGGGFGSGVVVIGPIVIAGTCAGTAPAKVPSTFPLEHQEKAYWCWAAVALAVKEYFSPATNLTQCSLAKKVLVAKEDLDPATDCCQPDSRCNSPAKLQDALAMTNNLSSIQPPLAWDDIKAQLSYALPRPVCVRIEWDDHSGAHFIAIYGYREFTSGVRQVLVADPLFTAGTAAYVLYEDVLNFYDQFGYWSHTFLVTP